MKLSHILLAAFVVVSGSSNAWAGNDKFRSSNGSECSTDNSTGKWAEFNAETNTATGDLKLSFTYKVELGRDKIRRNNCDNLAAYEYRRQELEIQRMQLELKLLQARANNTQTTNNNNSNDW